MEPGSSTGMEELIHGWDKGSYQGSCSRAKAEEAVKPCKEHSYGHLKLMWDFPRFGIPQDAQGIPGSD